MPDLDAVAEELYGLPREEFVAARTRYQSQARRAGARELAAGIRSLAKPSVSAWLANQLVRERREDLVPLLDLGAGLREATRRLAGDQLRELSRQRQQLVAMLTHTGGEIGRARGYRVSDAALRGLEDTLQAALADESAACKLLTGRLTEALRHTGFGELASRSASPGKPTLGASDPSPTNRGAADRRERAVRRADAELAAAEAVVTDAAGRLADLTARAREADEAVATATERVDRLRRELDEAGIARSAAEQARDGLAAERADADRELTRARARADAARAARDLIVDGS